jgi:hypothetical protein
MIFKKEKKNQKKKNIWHGLRPYHLLRQVFQGMGVQASYARMKLHLQPFRWYTFHPE